MDVHAELFRAERRLADAYAQARTVNYQAGSVQMHELTAAEDAYQQARGRSDRARPTSTPSPADPARGPAPVANPSLAQIDLRDPADRPADTPKPPAVSGPDSSTTTCC